jgi:hypothetical protein
VTYLLSIDPGQNTGAAIGYYDAVTPYRLIGRYQIHGGVKGFVNAVQHGKFSLADEMVVESFALLRKNKFVPDLTPIRIEGAIETMMLAGTFLIPDFVSWQQPSDKGGLIGYSKEAREMQGQSGITRRQRERFDFLDRFGLFKAGTENDDSNDAITHALVNLKRRGHAPTQDAFWPRRERLVSLEQATTGITMGQGF